MPQSTICEWVYDLLNITVAEMTPGQLQKWSDSAMAKLRIEWPTIPAYAELTGDDLAAMDEAVGFLVAAKLKRAKAQSEPTTDLVSVRVEGGKYQFAQPTPDKNTVSEEWLKTAYEALSRISVIRTTLTDLRAISLFQAAGPRRAQEARGVNTHSINPLFTILADEWDYEREHPQLWWYAGFMPPVTP